MIHMCLKHFYFNVKHIVDIHLPTFDVKLFLS